MTYLEIRTKAGAVVKMSAAGLDTAIINTANLAETAQNDDHELFAIIQDPLGNVTEEELASFGIDVTKPEVRYETNDGDERDSGSPVNSLALPITFMVNYIGNLGCDREAVLIPGEPVYNTLRRVATGTNAASTTGDVATRSACRRPPLTVAATSMHR